MNERFVAVSTVTGYGQRLTGPPTVQTQLHLTLMVRYSFGKKKNVLTPSSKRWNSGSMWTRNIPVMVAGWDRLRTDTTESMMKP